MIGPTWIRSIAGRFVPGRAGINIESTVGTPNSRTIVDVAHGPVATTGRRPTGSIGDNDRASGAACPHAGAAVRAARNDDT